MSFLQELEKIMAGYRLSGEGYTDEEMRVLKRMCKSMLADIDEFLRKKEEKKKKERIAMNPVEGIEESSQEEKAEEADVQETVAEALDDVQTENKIED